VSSHIQLIVGLGNPGTRYSGTRHNAGFWFVDKLTDKFSARFSTERKFFGDVARLQVDKSECLLLKPGTFMNESGRAVRAIMDYYNIGPEELLVVHDEIDFDPGIIRLKQNGGDAGHNGVRDIIDHVSSNNFLRLRIGVGHPGHKDKVTGSVLGKPTRTDQKLIMDAIAKGIDVLPLILIGEYAKAMNVLHTDSE